MKCKICGTRFIGTSPQLGAFSIMPNCDCGTIRAKLRTKGCGVCGIGPKIRLEKKPDGYIATCPKCSMIWRVEG